MKTGDVLENRYRLVRRLGSGGMSAVWLAEDSQLQRPVALKILRPDLEDPGLSQRLAKEASLLARIESPHIVPLYESGTLPDGSPYLVMKYIEGQTLDKMGVLPVSETRRIFAEILSGLQTAHDAGIVHRDIKPSNVIISTEGQAYLFDFGVARDTRSGDNLTETGTVIGTAHYLSPEQAHGEEATVQSDLYSLGVMLYEALTGRPPWPGESSIARAVGQALEPAEPPSRFNKNVDPRLDKTTLRAIAYRPELRFASAEEFRQALLDQSPLRGGRAKWLWLLLPLLLLGGWFWWQNNQTTVPQTVGKSLLQAREELSRADLQWYTREIFSEKPKGQIVRTSPDAGTKTRKNSVVVLWVSKGPELFAVPLLAGLQAAEAEELLQEVGLRGRREGMFSALPKGTVVRSNPASGTRLEEGSEVTIWVSRGPAPLLAPECIGLDETSCREAAGELQISIEYWSSEAPAGEVLDQFPAAGEATKTLKIYVSKGSQIIVLPDVVGQRQGSARRDLVKLGLGVILSSEETDDPALRGTVVRQDPAAGTELLPGDSVKLFIGKSPSTPE